MTDARTQAIHAWMEADAARKQWTAREMELRLFIAAQGWGYNPAQDMSALSGTQRLDLGNGYALKAVFAIDTSIKEGPAFDAALAGIRSMSGGYIIQDKVIKHKPQLIKRGYDEAAPDVRRLLLPAIETKNKAPTLQLETPK